MYQGSGKKVTGLLPVLCRHVSRSSHGPPSLSTVLSDSVALRRNFSSESAESSEAFGRKCILTPAVKDHPLYTSHIQNRQTECRAFKNYSMQ